MLYFALINLRVPAIFPAIAVKNLQDNFSTLTI